MIEVSSKGNFDKTFKFLRKAKSFDITDLRRFGDAGVEALSRATPIDTGLTAESWYYTIEKTSNSIKIQWSNRNVQDGVPIAVILQLGHGTGSGGYVEGIDYINPAMKPLFDEIAENAWGAVMRV